MLIVSLYVPGLTIMVSPYLASLTAVLILLYHSPVSRFSIAPVNSTVTVSDCEPTLMVTVAVPTWVLEASIAVAFLLVVVLM